MWSTGSATTHRSVLFLRRRPSLPTDRVENLFLITRANGISYPGYVFVPSNRLPVFRPGHMRVPETRKRFLQKRLVRRAVKTLLVYAFQSARREFSKYVCRQCSGGCESPLKGKGAILACEQKKKKCTDVDHTL